MKSMIVYKKDKNHTTNAVQDQQSYKAEILVENDQINLNFIFSKGAKGLSNNSEVFAAMLSFSQQEALEINAALNGILHHPKIKGERVEWIKE